MISSRVKGGCADWGRQLVQPPGVGGRSAKEFVETEGEQIDQRCPARQGLGDFFHDMELLGAGQNELSGAILTIHDALNVGEQRRCPLDLVQNHPAAEAPQKTFWVGYGEFPFVRVFQADIGVIAEERLGQGGFARLTGTGDGDHRELLRQRGQFIWKVCV